MTTRLNPYIIFPHSAEEALELYQRVFGGTVTITHFSQYGLADTPDADKVMHGQLETPTGFTLMCGDTPTGMAYEPGRNMAISLSGNEPEQLRAWFEALADGGQVAVPLEKQLWGDEFGQVIDRFGVVWVVDIHDDAASADEGVDDSEM